MAVTLVQRNGNTSATNNPQIQLTTRVSAGNFLLALVSHNSLQPLGTPICSMGDQYQLVAEITHPSGLAISAFRVPSIATRGFCTTTFSTVAPSSFAVAELSGVQADTVGVGGEDGIIQPNSTSMAWSSGTDHYTTANPMTATDFVLAFLFIQGQTTPTFVSSGWTTVSDTTSSSVTLSVRSLQLGALGPITAQWTTPAGLAVSCVGSFSFSP
jgi:hypothetical protein